MLKRLSIKNYALIEEMQIDFERGLTIITGETGAGKSIILGALSLILGERAEAKSIRDTSQKTIVEAKFDVSDYGLESFFERNDLDEQDGECIVRREITPTGRSRAFINDTPTQLTTLKELATRVIDIHSQHSNMLLASPRFQLAILDSLVANPALLQTYREDYDKWRAAQKALEQAQEEFDRARADEDYTRFQLQQLEQLGLQSGEDETLEAEHLKLANAGELKEALWHATTELNGDETGLLIRLQQVARALEQIEDKLPEINGFAERINAAAIDIKDIDYSISALASSLHDDPALLQQIEQRINEIEQLKSKHRVATVDELLQLQERFAEQLRRIDNNDEFIAQLTAEAEQAKQRALKKALALSEARKKVAKKFEAQLTDLAKGLGMKNLRFQVDFKTVELGESGIDDVAFMMAFNKQQPLMPVKDTASGGEISRVMLCIKTIVARAMRLPTIIFDEVDTGISGDVASRVGEMMAEIAERIQVIAITHLPQVAAHARQHIRVYKTDTDTATTTAIELLDEQQHIREVARMLSGKQLDEAAISNAKSLINATKKSS